MPLDPASAPRDERKTREPCALPCLSRLGADSRDSYRPYGSGCTTRRAHSRQVFADARFPWEVLFHRPRQRLFPSGTHADGFTASSSRFSFPQSAVEALKMSQALLLRVYGDRRDRNNLSGPGDPPVKEARNAGHPSAAKALVRGAPSVLNASEQPSSPPPPIATGSGVEAPSNAHVQELTVQATKLRDMTRSVKGLLELATSSVEGGLDGRVDGKSSVGLGGQRSAPGRSSTEGGAVAEKARGAVAVVAAATQTEGGGEGRDEMRLNQAVLERLRAAEAAAQAFGEEKTRLDAELENTSAELRRLQELLRTKTAQVCGRSLASRHRPSQSGLMVAWLGAKYRDYCGAPSAPVLPAQCTIPCLARGRTSVPPT